MGAETQALEVNFRRGLGLTTIRQCEGASMTVLREPRKKSGPAREARDHCRAEPSKSMHLWTKEYCLHKCLVVGRQVSAAVSL